ncbi:MAG: hypothetical protein ACWA40_04805 [Planktomarina sp.]
MYDPSVVTTNLDADLALIIGVSVSAIFSVLATVFAFLANRAAAKAQAAGQIAQFRQQWINELRDDLAEFHSIGVTPEHTPDTDMEFYRIGTRIELMMNPDDEDYKELQEIMYGYLKTARSSTLEKYANNPRLVDISQRILKREWERLKNDVRNGKI